MSTKTKILVISNDLVLHRFVQENLNEHDYDIASTPYIDEELRTTLDRELPDMVILDIIMPSLDGIEVCLRIRQWSQVPIMMLTAWGAGEGKVRGLDLSANSYLTEPFGADRLMAWINETLQRNYVAMMNLLSNINPGISQ